MKKGDFSLSDADHMLFFLLIIVPILLIVTGFIMHFTSTYDHAVSGVLPNLEYKVHENVLIKNCFAYASGFDQERVYTGVIDTQKFNTETLNNCLKLERASQLGITAHLYIIEDERNIMVESENLGLKSPRFRERFTYPVRVTDRSSGEVLFNKTGILTVTYLK